MATERPRIQVMLDEQTGALLAGLSEQQDRSLSAVAADLIREALELHEDAALSKLADTRLAKTKRWHSPKAAWGE